MHVTIQDLQHLKEEHDVFRMQLDVVEAAMDLGTRGGAVLRDLSRELFLKLRLHVRRESRLAVIVSRRLGRIDAAQLAKFAIEHDAALETLRVIRRSLPPPNETTLRHLRPALRMLVSSLRRHMCDQEQLLFPLLHQELAAMEAERAQEPERAAQSASYALARSFGLISPF